MADSQQNNQASALPKSGVSLAEAMARGREARQRMEVLEQEEARCKAETRAEAGGAPTQGEGHSEDQEGSGNDTDEEEYNMMVAGLSEMALLMKKPKPVDGTGFIYDERFTLHHNEWSPNFPEKPARVSSSYQRCCDLGLVDRCTRLEARYGREDEVQIQHSQRQIDVLQQTATMSLEERKALARKNEDVYFCKDTFECAMLCVGSTIEMMEQILKKNIRNGFALVRPPGHHAMTERFCGFCFYNNVAIAAKHALDNLGLNRVLIVDWDVHHGQATQQMFYNDPRVLYISIHRYEYGSYWPHLRESDYDYVGEGEGRGYNINVPLNQIELGDSDYLAIFHQVIMPVAYQYDPDLVLISCGYDAAIGCPEFMPDIVLLSCGYDAAIGDMKGQMRVSPAAYAHFVHMMSQLAQGRVCTVLEGGYNIKSLSEGVALTLRELLGDPCPMLNPTTEPSDSVTESILNVIKCVAPYWSCLGYQTELDEDELSPFDGVNVDPPREGVEFMTEETQPTEYSLDYIYPYNVEEEYIQAEERWTSVIDQMIAETSLTVPPNRTCLVYDKGMKAHKALDYPNHPERPDRISRIYDKHVEWGLVDRCLVLKSRLAKQEEIELCHSPKHTEFMQSLEEKDLPELLPLQNKLNSVYLCKETNICALMAAGSTLNVIDTVMSGQARNGVAIVRPPGHHAECGKPMGFCFYNSVAIAAKYAQKHYGAKRVLIVDWDVHHGNGTQHMFYDDPSVLYISLHRYDGGHFFPGSCDGNVNMVGRGAGLGFNINIPWHYGGKGDAEYLAAFQQIVMPVAYEYAPDLVLISAGFDAAIGDPLGGCLLTPVGYGHMTHMLSGLANGRVVLVLEGGYNLVSISNSMAMCTSVLLGDPLPPWKYEQPKNIAVMTICEVLDTHKQYWKSLKFRVAIPKKERDDIQEQSTRSTKKDKRSKNKTPPKKEDLSTLTDQIATMTVSDAMAEAGSSNGAEGGEKLTSNKDLLNFYEKQGVDAMYAVEPLKWCEHLELVASLPDGGLNVADPCADCQATGENWVCLVCYKVYCSRYVKEHMVKHGEEANHPVVLSYADLSVWCYKCDNYLDNEVLKPAKNSAHKSKFGTDM